MAWFSITSELEARVESYRKTSGGKWYHDVYFKLIGSAGYLMVGTFQCETAEQAKDKAIKYVVKVSKHL